MPVNCSVPGCYNNSKKNPDVKFHSFPADAELKYRWATVIKRGKPWGRPITPYTKVCSDHFDVDNYSPSLSGLSMVLSKNAVPSLLRLPQPKDERDAGPGSSETRAQETSSSKDRVVLHLNAVRKTRRKTNLRDARNYSRDDARWASDGSGGRNGQAWTPTSTLDREVAQMDSGDVGFMPVEVILRTYEDFDGVLGTEGVS